MLSHAGIGLCAGAGIVLAAELLLHVHASSESSDTHDQDNAWGQGLAPSPWTASTIPPCSDVMLRYQAVPAVASTPPRSMPADTVRGFTADGAIPTAEFFVDDTIGGKGSHYQYPLKVNPVFVVLCTIIERWGHDSQKWWTRIKAKSSGPHLDLRLVNCR